MHEGSSKKRGENRRLTQSARLRMRHTDVPAVSLRTARGTRATSLLYTLVLLFYFTLVSQAPNAYYRVVPTIIPLDQFKPVVTLSAPPEK